LIVDDIDYNRDMLRIYLEGCPFTFGEAVNGKEAIEKVKSRNPDIILLDMKMPVMDGYQTMEVIKQEKGLNHIPIIAITASAFKEDEQRITDMCDGYLRKPVSLKDLFRQLMRFLPHSVIPGDELAAASVSTQKAEIKKLIKEDIATLPEEFQRQFTSALKGGDFKLCHEIIGQLNPQYDMVAASLTKMVENFRFEEILNLIEQKS